MLTLVFLHGLLGSKTDWQKVIENLPHFRCISIDLPLHGAEQNANISDFESSAQFLAKKIRCLVGKEPYILIGYSLGGRLALYYAYQAKIDRTQLKAVVAEGANLGLDFVEERLTRWLHDQKWAMRFSNETMENVLSDWYQQPIFNHLSETERRLLILKRKHNRGSHIGKMLMATSLARQPNFYSKVRSDSLPFFYFCGERDRKFCTLARKKGLPFTLIEQAGHNAHLENPLLFAQKLDALIADLTEYQV